MDHRLHAQRLGALVGNLQTLEASIRLCLAQQPGSPARDVFMDDFRDAPVGTVIPESAMSNYDSLGKLIEKFNDMFETSGVKVDHSLVTLRDVLAHGRVFAGPNDIDFRIVKFDKPTAAGARLSYNQLMTAEWFEDNRMRLREAIQTVVGQLNSALLPA